MTGTISHRASTEDSVLQHRSQRPTRSLRRAGTLLAALALALTGLQTPAHAAYNDDQVGCRSGDSGTACVRLQYDPVAHYYRARGATDPNPGYGMYLRTVQLVDVYQDSFGTHYDVVRQAAGGNSMSYQVVFTADYYQGYYRCDRFYGTMRFSTVSGTYDISTPLSIERCRT